MQIKTVNAVEALPKRENKPPKVSVCVVTYNQEKYIAQCLQSIVDQDFDFDFEILVADDCSTDGTQAIVRGFSEKYPDKFRLFFQKNNIGAFHNYKFIHEQAIGQFIAHMDGDDYWGKYKLKNQVEFMEKHQECSGVFSNAWVINEQGQVVGIFSNNVPMIFDYIYLIKDGNFLTHSSLLYRSKFRPLIIPKKEYFLDYDVYINLSRHGNLGFIENNLAYYRNESTTSIIFNNKYKIKSLVWGAICEASTHDANKSITLLAKANFISRELINCLRSRDIEWLMACARKIKSNKDSSLLYFSTLVFLRFLFNAVKIAKHRINSDKQTPRNLKVFFKR